MLISGSAGTHLCSFEGLISSMIGYGGVPLFRSLRVSLAGSAVFFLQSGSVNGTLAGMNTKQLFLTACCCAGIFASDLMAETRSIRLESVKTGKSYGPFMIRNDAPVVLGDGIYRIDSSNGGKISFRSERSGSVSGPYEVTMGRIVKVGPDVYTIVDIDVHETPPPVPAAVDRRVSPQPARGARSAGGPGLQQAASRQPVHGLAGTTVGMPERHGRSFMDGVGIAFDVAVFDRVDYTRTLTGGLGMPDTAMTRNSASAALRTGRLVLKGGMVFSSEWEDMLSGNGLAFANADLQNGEGWWTEAELRNHLWQSDAWRLDFNVTGSYRRETYDLSYGALQQAGTVLVEGTNGSPGTVVQLLELVQTDAETVFTESLLKLGVVLSRAAAHWSGYLGFDVAVYEDAELDTPISTSTVSYDIEFERRDPFSIMAGASVRKLGIHWFADLSVIGEDSLRLGAALVF